MRKLTLESLEVESFVTAAPSRLRGTINAHGDIKPSPVIETYDVALCGETRYFDCSLGCPSIAPCDLTETLCG